MLLKRFFDVVLATAALVALAPIFGAVALGVALSSPGGVLFRQERVGLDGRVFSIFKFRSMVANAEAVGPYFTSAADSRITPLGRFLRRTSLDELPQLVNVIKGDMSLVGPRPDVPAQRSNYTDEEWLLRHAVRPGITGLAQATSRSECTADERKRLDIEYAQSATLWLDIKILFLTVHQVLFKGGN